MDGQILLEVIRSLMPSTKPERGPNPSFVLANHGDLPPPEGPLLRFPSHSAPVKFDVAPQEHFWKGQIFVALFGDEKANDRTAWS